MTATASFICFCLMLPFLSDAKARSEGEWSEWSEWRTATHDNSIKSFPAPDQPLPEDDIGRQNFAAMKEMKLKIREETRACRLAGTCPELDSKPDTGPSTCTDGVVTGGELCDLIDQLSFVAIASLSPDGASPDGNDIWGWTDTNGNGDDYALMGLSDGLSMVRITDRVNPFVIGFMRTQTASSTWRDMKVIGDFVYVVSEAANHGMQVFDLTRLRGVDTFTEYTPDVHYAGIGNCHNIVANEAPSHIFGVGCTQAAYESCRGGLHVVDVSNPFNPTFAGCFESDGYVHDAQCVVYAGPDARYTGREICFCYNEDTFTIVDMTLPQAGVMISRTGYGEAQYTHQGWVTEDHAMALLDDELDEQNGPTGTTKTYLWDITDLQNPVLRNTHVAPRLSIDHNQYIIGDLTYQANYMSGLRILRIDQVAFTLTELAYFDVWPENNLAAFFGSWSVYPYYANGDVVVSSIEFGMYVLRPNYAAFAAIGQTTTKSERSRFREVLSSCSGCQRFEVERQ